MNRRTDFEEDLARMLRKPAAAQGFIMSLMDGDDGLSLEDALRDTIKCMGIKEFSELSGIPSPHISEFLNGKRKPKPETLDVYLKPFGLKTKITAVKAS